jgi:hypothetical protein
VFVHPLTVANNRQPVVAATVTGMPVVVPVAALLLVGFSGAGDERTMQFFAVSSSQPVSGGSISSSPAERTYAAIKPSVRRIGSTPSANQ